MENVRVSCLQSLDFEKSFSVNNLGSPHAQNSQHSKTSVRKFHTEGTQLLGRLVVHFLSEVSSSEISWDSSLLLLDENFVKSNGDDHLAPSGKWDDVEGGQTIRDILKLEVFRSGD